LLDDRNIFVGHDMYAFKPKNDNPMCEIKPDNINPTCEIVLNAKSLFILDCVNPTTVPITKDKRELKSKLVVQEKSMSTMDLPV
jgi:hypothetical protein